MSAPGHAALRNADALEAAGLIDTAAHDAIAAVERRYAVAITPAMRALIARPDDPIGRQFIPDPAELITAPHEFADPIGDDALSPIKGVVHRYPDRALLKPLLVCPVYCRFCFRREHVGPDGGLLSKAELQAAYAWFAARPAIREVILTGGDPLMLSPRRLGGIVARSVGHPAYRVDPRSYPGAGGRSGAGNGRAGGGDGGGQAAVACGARQPCARVHAGGARGVAAGAGAGHSVAGTVGAAAWGQRQRRGAGGAVSRHAGGAGEAGTTCISSIRRRGRHGFTCRSRRGGGCWPRCAGGSPGWPGRPMCWIFRAATGRCRSGRTTWTRTGAFGIRAACGTCRRPGSDDADGPRP